MDAQNGSKKQPDGGYCRIRCRGLLASEVISRATGTAQRRLP
jgi:hypothetical protein